MATNNGIGAGRPATRAATGYRADGRTARPDAPRPDLATAEDFAALRETLTSEEAKRVLDAVARQRGYFTRLDLAELRVWAEAEGNSIIYDRKVAELRDRGEDVPIMVTIKKGESQTVQAYGVGGMAKRSAEAEGNSIIYDRAEGNSIIYDRKVAELRDRGADVPIMVTIKKGESQTVQAYGVGGMAKRSAEEARQSRNALCLNKATRNRIVDEAVQGDLFADGVAEQAGPPENMPDEELDAALARVGANILPFVRTAAVAGE